MPTYLERYQNGECEQVWAELTALGEQVRQEPLLSDALAVARETMLRVRKNAERIISRLQRIKYDFDSSITSGGSHPAAHSLLLKTFQLRSQN